MCSFPSPCQQPTNGVRHNRLLSSSITSSLMNSFPILYSKDEQQHPDEPGLLTTRCSSSSSSSSVANSLYLALIHHQILSATINSVMPRWRTAESIHFINLVLDLAVIQPAFFCCCRGDATTARARVFRILGRDRFSNYPNPLDPSQSVQAESSLVTL